MLVSYHRILDNMLIKIYTDKPVLGSVGHYLDDLIVGSRFHCGAFKGWQKE